MGVFSMLDEFTLNEMQNYIEKRIEKHKGKLKFYKKDDFRYATYRNLIMELQVLKDYIKSKR